MFLVHDRSMIGTLTLLSFFDTCASMELLEVLNNAPAKSSHTITEYYYLIRFDAILWHNPFLTKTPSQCVSTCGAQIASTLCGRRDPTSFTEEIRRANTALHDLVTVIVQ